MSRTFTCIPAAPGRVPGADLVYNERSSRSRGLHVLMQDAAVPAVAARGRFLQAAYRNVVSRYLSADAIMAPAAFLRETLRSLDALSRAVDTRLDDLGGIGLFVAVRDADGVHLLCTRGASARLRANGVFVPLGSPGLDSVSELPIDTTRAQQDLFARSLPEALVLYHIRADATPDGVARELLLGGTNEDVGAAVESLDLHGRPAGEMREVERLRRTVMCVTIDPVAPCAAPSSDDAKHAAAASPRVARPLRVPRAAIVTGVVVVVAGAAALIAIRAGRDPGQGGATRAGSASVEPAPAQQVREIPAAPAPAPVAEKEAEAPAADDAGRRGFAVAWEQSYRGAVTSSPALVNGAVVFGSRDGRVYALDRTTGERVWAYAAAGGVGASPVVRGGAVIVADYGGNVARLDGGNGRVAWKRALREKIVSTPAVTRERVVAGTVRGNVAAISLETGRVLWKFAARGQIRGTIVHAGESFLVPSHDGRLYALAEDTGRKRWSVSLGGPVASSPASDGDMVVVGAPGGDVVALDLATGARRWRRNVGGPVNSSLALAGGAVYAGAGDRRLHCIDAKSGEVRWRFDTGGVILSRPHVADGRVLVTSYDGVLYCLDAESGELVDRIATSDAIFSSPLVAGNRVYFGNNDGRFYCIEAPRS
jgi:outer membrane protein assembly factor BamB